MAKVRATTPRSGTKKDLARAEILAAAASMMREVGYSEMSVRDLADRVNMKAGSLYYHFSSKNELVTEVMQIGVRVVEAAVSEGLAKQPDAAAKERIVIAIRIHLETMLRASDFVSCHIRCYPFVPRDVRERLRDVRQGYDRIWLQLVHDYLGSEASFDDVRYLRHVLIGALHGALEWFNPDRDTAAAFAKRIESLL